MKLSDSKAQKRIKTFLRNGNHKSLLLCYFPSLAFLFLFIQIRAMAYDLRDGVEAFSQEDSSFLTRSLEHIRYMSESASKVLRVRFVAFP